jgi:hypothetical protein
MTTLLKFKSPDYALGFVEGLADPEGFDVYATIEKDGVTVDLCLDAGNQSLIDQIVECAVKDNEAIVLDPESRNVTVYFHMPDGSVVAHGGCIMSDDMMRRQYRTFGPSDKPSWPCRGDERKHVSDKVCSGKEVACLAGRDGKCVACTEDD